MPAPCTARSYVPPPTPEKIKPRRNNQDETMDAEMDAFFMGIESPMPESPTLQTKKGKAASLTTRPSYFLTPPPQLRGNVLFSAVKPRDPQADADHVDADESPSRTCDKDDGPLRTWHDSSSGTSSSESDSMALSTPPQPERMPKMEDLPQKVQNQPRMADVLFTPESPAPKFGARAPFTVRLEDSPLNSVSAVPH